MSVTHISKERGSPSIWVPEREGSLETPGTPEAWRTGKLWTRLICSHNTSKLPYRDFKCHVQPSFTSIVSES